MSLLLLGLPGTAVWAAFPPEAIAAYRQQNYAELSRQLQPLVKQNDPASLLALGMLLEQGAGVARNLPQAIAFYRLAASQHQPEALVLLGGVYQYGVGGKPRSSVAAYALYVLAAENPGNQVAKRALDGLARQMNKQEIAAGLALSQAFHQPKALLPELDSYLAHPTVEETPLVGQAASPMAESTTQNIDRIEPLPAPPPVLPKALPPSLPSPPMPHPPAQAQKQP